MLFVGTADRRQFHMNRRGFQSPRTVVREITRSKLRYGAFLHHSFLSPNDLAIRRSTGQKNVVCAKVIAEMGKGELRHWWQSVKINFGLVNAYGACGLLLLQLLWRDPSRLHLRSRRLAQDVGDAPGTIEIRALADLDFTTVGTSQLVSAGV
jgi:hypothetical protein